MINPQKGIDLFNNNSIISRIYFAVTIFQHRGGYLLGFIEASPTAPTPKDSAEHNKVAKEKQIILDSLKNHLMLHIAKKK
jgi:hypothetical protein